MAIDGKFIEWQAAQTDGNVMTALGRTCQAISVSNIVGIVGPGLSREAHTIAEFAKTVGIPAISYGATDPELSDRNAYPAFYRTIPSDNTAALSIVKLFIQFNWTSCIIIYQNDAFGYGGAKIIREAFINNELLVKNLIVFDIATRSIPGNLKKQLTSSSTRIIILWAQTSYTYLILQRALDDDVLGPQFTWILSSSVPLDFFNQTTHQKLIGILTVEPTVGTVVNAPVNITLLNAAYNIWQKYEPESFPGAMEVDNDALFAFDATWLLILSLQQLCSTTDDSSPSCISIVGSSFCFNRRFLNSKSFLDTIGTTIFLGASGLVQFGVNVTDRINGIYYLSQNVQPNSNGVNYVPVLVWSDSDGWKPYTGSSIIVWPGNSFQPPTDRPILSGVSLRIAVFISHPFTMSTDVIDQFGQKTTKLVGYVPDLIDLLQNKMGFIPHVALTPNWTFVESIQAVENGVYDMLIGDITITAARREIADFSSTIFDTALRIIVRKKPDVSVDLLSYMRPFKRSLWLMLLGASIYASVLIFLFERQENESLKNKSIISSGAMSGWYAIGTLLGYGADFEVRTAAGRLLTVGLYILSLVLIATYTANLASELTISKSNDLISGVHDVKNGKIPFNRIGIRVGTASEDFYLREISRGNRDFYPLTSREELFHSLLNGMIDAAFMDSDVAEYSTNNIFCNLTLVGTSFDKGAFGIVIPKQWIYGQDLDVNILSLKESGALDDLKRKWFQTNNCSLSSATSNALEIDTMSGLFLTFAVISVLSLFVFAWNQRYIIKDYLIILARQKTSLNRKIVSARTRSTQSSKRSKKFRLASLSELRF